MKRSAAAASALTLCIAVLAAGSDAAPSLEPRIAFWRWHPYAASRIYSVRPTGSRLRRMPFRARGRLTSPAWSPDGRRLAFVGNRACSRAVGICYEIWTSEPSGRRTRRLVRSRPEEEHGSPAWSPDGRTIAFERASIRGNFSLHSIYAVGADGRGLRQLTRDHYDEDPVWSPDGQTIFFSRQQPIEYEIDWTQATLMLVNADGTGLKRLSRTAADERSPTWSPDGKWIAYSRGYRLHGFRRYRIFRIRPNGEGRRLVVEMDRSLYDPAWRPR